MGTISTYLKAHERLIIVILVLAVGAWGFNHWLNSSAQAAKAKEAVAEQQLDVQKKENDNLAQQASQAAANYQATLELVTKQNSVLAAAVASRQTILEVKQTKDQSLPLPDLAKRWQSLAGIGDGLTASASGIIADESAARLTVTTLEKVPVLESNLQDETAIAQNNSKALDKQAQVVVDLNNQITGLNKQATDQGKASQAEIASVKASSRVSKRNWFLKGAAVGAAVVIYVAIHL